MKKKLFGIAAMLAVLPWAGCEGKKKDVDVQAPGVDVKVDDKGVDIQAPGVDVKTEKEQ